MAVVKMNQIKTTLDKAIAYVINGAKTEDGRLVSTNYSNRIDEPDWLAHGMMNSIDRSARGHTKNGVLAHHIIQSFDPKDHITPEEAHRIGEEFIQRISDGDHKYVIATHVDRQHIHNHILLCSANDNTGQKIRVQRNTLKDWRAISDELCVENKLNVIRHDVSDRYGRSMAEIYTGARGEGVKDAMRTLIDATAARSRDFSEFIRLLEGAGLECVQRGRHLTFTDQASGLKIRDVKLGLAYDEPNIMAKISREPLRQITFNERQIAHRDPGKRTVSVWLPGTRRTEQITIPLDRLTHSGRTWRAYLGMDAVQTVHDKHGRYLRTLAPDQIYEYFSQPEIQLTSLVNERLPYTPGVSEAQRRYYMIQAADLDRLREQARELTAAARWTRDTDGDLSSGIDALIEHVRQERDGFQTAVVALAEAAEHGESGLVDESREQAELKDREARIEDMDTDLRALKRLQARLAAREEPQREQRGRFRSRSVRR